jgi:hypothetical protein
MKYKSPSFLPFPLCLIQKLWFFRVFSDFRIRMQKKIKDFKDKSLIFHFLSLKSFYIVCILIRKSLKVRKNQNYFCGGAVGNSGALGGKPYGFKINSNFEINSAFLVLRANEIKSSLVRLSIFSSCS